MSFANMLQYCVLYAKIRKLNVSNRMNKANRANEVYEEADLRAGSVYKCKPVSSSASWYRCFLLAWAAPNYIVQKINDNG